MVHSDVSPSNLKHAPKYRQDFIDNVLAYCVFSSNNLDGSGATHFANGLKLVTSLTSLNLR